VLPAESGGDLLREREWYISPSPIFLYSVFGDFGVGVWVFEDFYGIGVA
jgi:hypothetical protein